MKYKILANSIQIFGKEDFNPQHILECGQIFSYNKTENSWQVFSADKYAEIVENPSGFVINTNFPQYFENFFDLKTNYSAIKTQLSKFDILKEPIKFGYGIRILKQDLFETLISFIISANNNIKRIKLILGRMKERFGEKKNGFYAFPTRAALLAATEEDFVKMGAGYRAKYLFKVFRQIDEDTLLRWQALPTEDLRKQLVKLAGVGPKVADCILLFGFARGDVFPVDTWIEKMFWKFYGQSELVKNLQKSQNTISREQIRRFLTQEFKNFSGYAQQYLFYFMRSGQ